VLALLEDAHWIDPTSVDAFSRIVERLQGLRVLMVATFRPEFQAPWLGRAHVTALSLNRFGRRHASTMIDRMTGGKALPARRRTGRLSNRFCCRLWLGDEVG
jgi:predicted ATPase